ncbi:MAG: type II secretion system minor pseudopilin GspK [Gammaproteobacteria bacterium]
MIRITRPRARGIALITAMLIAALTTAGAVALATTQQFGTRRVANLLTLDRAHAAVGMLERDAARLLRDDLQRGRYDALDEPWREVRLRTVQGDLTLSGRLRDLQGRFNLNNLASDPRVAGAPTGVASPPAAGATAAAADASQASLPNPDGNATNALAPGGGAPVAGGPTPPGVTPVPGTAPGVADATPSREAQAEQQLRLLFKTLEIDPTPVQALLDWIDPDTDARFPNGAEDDYYTELTPPYRAANRPLLSVRELLLVKGITEETFRKLAPFVVCLPQTTAINVNTAPKEVLMSLSPTLDPGTAGIILRARETQPFITLESFTRHPLLQFREIPAGSVSVASEWFQLTSRVRDARMDVRIVSLLARSGGEVNALRRWRENFDE